MHQGVNMVVPDGRNLQMAKNDAISFFGQWLQCKTRTLCESHDAKIPNTDTINKTAGSFRFLFFFKYIYKEVWHKQNKSICVH